MDVGLYGQILQSIVRMNIKSIIIPKIMKSNRHTLI